LVRNVGVVQHLIPFILVIVAQSITVVLCPSHRESNSNRLVIFIIKPGVVVFVGVGMHKPAVALSACKQRHKRGNQLVSQALSLDESANWEGNERNRLAIQQQIEKSAVIVKLYREGAECLRGILRENPSRLAK
jgi:hypothetical protein